MSFIWECTPNSGILVTRGGAFIRAFGWVLMLKTPAYEPLFSERYGFRKHYGIAGYRFRGLMYQKHQPLREVW